jgi:hypothetical protein
MGKKGSSNETVRTGDSDAHECGNLAPSDTPRPEVMDRFHLTGYIENVDAI